MRMLRPARKVLTGSIVAAAATACLVSASSSPSAAPQEPQSVTQATREWKNRAVEVRTAELANVAQSAYPAFSTTRYEQRVATLINRTRHRHHLRGVTLASCADKAANRWSAHLASTNSFRHQSMQSLLRRCNARYAGEILGRGSVRPATLVSLWMNSPPHRHVLLSPKPRRIGVGATPNARGEWVVAVNFMRF